MNRVEDWVVDGLVRSFHHHHHRIPPDSTCGGYCLLLIYCCCYCSLQQDYEAETGELALECPWVLMSPLRVWTFDRVIAYEVNGDQMSRPLKAQLQSSTCCCSFRLNQVPRRRRRTICGLQHCYQVPVNCQGS